jgi:MFS transporter, ACS family, allantoate permease
LTLLSSILIKSLGFNSKTTLLFAMPSGGLQIIFQLTVGFIADKTRQRCLSGIGIHTVSLFAASLLVGLGNVGPLYLRNGQLAAYFIMIGSCAIGYYILLSMVSSNVLGTTKKTTTNVILFISMAAAYLVGPQIFRDPPHYYKAKYATIGLWVASILTLVIMYFLNTWENKKRDRDAESSGPPIPGVEFMDLTDKENKAFRYVV